jgi:hypothetical protein
LSGIKDQSDLNGHNCRNIEVLAVAMNGAYSTGVMYAQSRQPMKKRYETEILQECFEDGFKSIKPVSELFEEEERRIAEASGLKLFGAKPAG